MEMGSKACEKCVGKKKKQKKNLGLGYAIFYLVT